MRIMCITAHSGGKQEFKAVAAWSEEMREAARAYAKKTRMREFVWVDKVLHPEPIQKKSRLGGNPHELLVKEMGEVDAILIVCRSSHPVEFNKLFELVGLYSTGTKKYDWSGILIEFVFIGEEHSFWSYHIQPTFKHIRKAGMERMLPGLLYLNGPGDVSHKELARMMVEKLRQKELARAA